MHKFHKFLIKEYGLCEKAILFGFSRDGLYAFNYALFYPEYVEKIYLDASVLNLKSWPKQNSKGQIQFFEEYIELFPCVPDEWKNEEMCFENLRARKGVLISAIYKNGTVTKLKIKAEKPQEIRIKNTFGKEKIVFLNGEEIDCKIGEIFSVEVEDTLTLKSEIENKK